MSEQQIEDITFKVEFPLSDDSVLNRTDKELAAEIQTELFEIYDKLNPFEDVYIDCHSPAGIGSEVSIRWRFGEAYMWTHCG